ncbi:MAG: glycosyltransferase family 2 protein [Syntrophus sp. (in: bacteria)]|nr:glycosyltransferase family 2 protein [Syntrophus sp. (in: bacteria)]
MVSVIIPTYKAGNVLDYLLLSLNKQTIDMEVIVVDSSSTDNTGTIAKDHNIKFISIDKKAFNHGATRNAATLHAKGDILVFMTQDALPLDQFCIETLIKPLQTESIAAVYGQQIPKNDASPTEKFARYFNYPEHPIIKGREHIPEMGIKTFFFSNVFSAIRRKEFEEIGGFPENVIMFEDMLFAAKLMMNGYKIAYVPEAKVIHSHNYSLAQQLLRYYQAGVSFKKNPWFMDYAGSNKEGIAFLREEMKFLFKEKEYAWIPCAVLEAMFKYMGYKMGLNHDKFPRFLNKRTIP